MNRITKNRLSTTIAAAAMTLLVVAFSAGPGHGQTKPARDPGSYHGELDFPISWKRYYA